MLVWEDGFCDFLECDQREGNLNLNGRFGADVFFKLSHEVYCYGEGLVGKVAADKAHKWVSNESSSEIDPNAVSPPYYLTILEPQQQPRAWETQFNSGIQTIAIVSVREGIVQLGSFDKIMEDLDLVMSIQRKFSYLYSIPFPGALFAAAAAAVERRTAPLQELALLPMPTTTTMCCCRFGALLPSSCYGAGDGVRLSSCCSSHGGGSSKRVKFEDEGDRCC